MPARTLTKQLGGNWLGTSGEAACPVCQPERRRDQHALTISWLNGRLLLNCKKSGCKYTDVLKLAQFPLSATTDNSQLPATPAKIEAGKRRVAAAVLAEQIMAASEKRRHDYLRKKGFPTLQLPTLSYGALREFMYPPKALGNLSNQDLLLCVPLSTPTGTLTSLQLVSDTGSKAFLPGGRIGGSGWFPCEHGARPMVLCEGVATALSILRSSKRIESIVSVGACMSAGGVAYMGRSGMGDAVMADNDISGTGKRAAQETGLLYKMPPKLGEDFNDLEQRSPSEADALLRAISFGIEWTVQKRASPPLRRAAKS